MPFAATWINLQILSKWEKDEHHMISPIYGFSIKTQLNLYTKHKQTHRYRKQAYVFPKGKRKRDTLGVLD